MRSLLQSKNFFSLKTRLLSFLFLSTLTIGRAEVEYIIPLTAKEHQIGNMLEWSTSTELNSHNFIIEKSLDGIGFSNIGLLDAAGISGEEKDYRFLDMGLNESRALYRLKQVDLDGHFGYSQTVLLNRSLPNQFMVVAMSNTSFDKKFVVTLDVLEDVSMEYVIMDLDDNIIQERKEQIEYGLNDLSFDFSEEKVGIYKIAIRIKDEEEFLVVQKTLGEKEAPNPVASKRMQNGG